MQNKKIKKKITKHHQSKELRCIEDDEVAAVKLSETSDLGSRVTVDDDYRKTGRKNLERSKSLVEK